MDPSGAGNRRGPGHFGWHLSWKSVDYCAIQVHVSSRHEGILTTYRASRLATWIAELCSGVRRNELSLPASNWSTMPMTVSCLSHLEQLVPSSAWYYRALAGPVRQPRALPSDGRQSVSAAG